MNCTVLLSYTKQAWKHALQPGNVVTLTWNREDTQGVNKDYSNLVVNWRTTSTYAILTRYMKFTSFSKPMNQ